jgi:hypothetical protein
MKAEDAGFGGDPIQCEILTQRRKDAEKNPSEWNRSPDF